MSASLNAEYKRRLPHAGVTQGELAAMEKQAAGFSHPPRVSVLLLVSDADEVWIKNSIDSVLRQVYPHLEVCACDNGSERPHVPQVLEAYAAVDGRVRVRRLPEKGSRAMAYGASLSVATGEFVVLLDAGDELAPEALFKVAEFLQRVPSDVVYTDEDHIDVVGERSDPVFKPHWSPDLLLSVPYVGRMCAIRKSVVEDAGGFREGFDGIEERDLLLRVSEKTDRIHHLPGVLYHRWVPSPRTTVYHAAGDGASVRAVEEALARRGENADVGPDGAGGALRVRRRLSGRPGVSVIFSATEGTGGAPFVDEMEQEAAYPVRQLILAGGGEGAYPAAERVSHPFPARALNLAAEKADSEYLVFTEGCARVSSPGWLLELLGHAQRRGVGAAGGKLLDPEGGLRHGGTFVDLSGLVGRERGAVLGGEGLPVVADLTFDPGTASAGCMMVRKDVFEAVGGFDDENLPTAFYDLDLSFRLREMGLRNVYTPYASLVCEGTRGRPPGQNEVAYMWRRWWGELVRLLYYERSPLARAPYRNEEAEAALLAALPS